MSEKNNGRWIDYSAKAPEAAGMYQWRVPSAACAGLVVTFYAHMRRRGAGDRDVLSPVFDHWDGYRVRVPAGTEWREASESLECASHDYVGLEAEGVSNAPCPFCKKVPTLKGWEAALGGGVYANSTPRRYNSWRLVCCGWAGSPYYSDPRKLAEARNAMLAARAQEPKA